MRKQLLWRGKNSNFNNFTLSQLRSNSNYPIFLKLFNIKVSTKQF